MKTNPFIRQTALAAPATPFIRRTGLACAALLLAFAFWAGQSASAGTIAELAQLPPDTPATIDQAVILSATNLEADPLYRSFQLRDATRAITVFGTVDQVEAVLAGRTVGDEVEISGMTGQRGGTTILGGTVGGFAVTGRTSTHPLPIFPVAALEMDVTGTAAETLESQLVVLHRVQFADTGVFAVGDYPLAGGAAVVRIASANLGLVGQPIPTGPVNITGILLQYDEGGGGPGGYRLVPRSPADLQAPGFTIAELAQLPPDTPATIDQAVILSATNLEADPLYRSFQLRDATRAITVFGTVAQVEAVLEGRAVGDEIQIGGVPGQRGGTLVLGGSVAGFAVTGRTSNHPFPIFPVAALELDLTGTAAETFESQLVCLRRVQFTHPGVFAVGDYPLAGGSTVVRIASANLGLVGQPIPAGLVNITGILLQYDEGGGGTSGYRLVLRGPDDIQTPGVTITELALLPPNTPVTIDQAVILSTTDLEPDLLYRSFQLRDATRAITVFGTTAQVDPVLAGRAVGDEIQISGVTGQRGGTLILAGSVGGFAISGRTSSHPFPTVSVSALVLDLAGATAETLESQLVCLHRVQFTHTGVFALGDYPLAGGSGVVRVASTNLGLVGLPIPTGPVNLTGILLQYDGTEGGTSGYRLVLRGPDDIQTPGVTITELALLPPNTPVTIDQAVILSTTDLEPDPLYRSFQLRDATRAITVFGTTAQVEAVLAGRGVGDEIQISGVTGQRGGTLILGGTVGGFAVTGRTTLHPIISGPILVTASDLTGTAAETLESQLVCLRGVRFADTGPFILGRDYALMGGPAIVRIVTADFELTGATIPSGPMDITGIVLHYDDGGTETSGYRLVPRSLADIVPAQTPEAPHLTIWHANDAVVLCWPASAEGWLLERADDLTGPWTPMPPPYPTTSGVISVPVTITPALKNQFFRLHQP
ncbi:MAG: hypothetical protein NTW21_38125 [Verrucomicrobia bacterium]|nr:hypothetical protein [Verrucomicrobiota bacterium]